MAIKDVSVATLQDKLSLLAEKTIASYGKAIDNHIADCRTRGFLNYSDGCRFWENALDSIPKTDGALAEFKNSARRLVFSTGVRMNDAELIAAHIGSSLMSDKLDALYKKCETAVSDMAKNWHVQNHSFSPAFVKLSDVTKHRVCRMAWERAVKHGNSISFAVREFDTFLSVCDGAVSALGVESVGRRYGKRVC